MEILDKRRRFKFLTKCFELRNDIRFQSWDNKAQDFSWYTFEDYKNLGRLGILFHCEELLRNAIETKTYSEYRIDIDQDLNKSIKIAKQINELFSKDNIKINWYYSGGKGLHGHFLFNVSNINLDLNNYNNRLKLRKLIGEYYNILNLIDNQLLSSEQQLTLEGGIKRRKLDKNSKSILTIYQNRKCLINLNLNEAQILQEIKINSKKIIINENYFNYVNNLSEDCINFIEKNYKQNELKTLNKKVVANSIDLLKKTQIKEISQDTDPNLYKSYTLTLITLYKKHNLNSNHRFIYYSLRLLYSITQDKDITFNEVSYICNKLNLNVNDDLKNQINIISSNSNKVYYGFKEKENNKGYDEGEFITLNGILKQNIL